MMASMTTPSEVRWNIFHGSQAEAYEEYLVPAIFGSMAADLVDRAAPRSGDRILDVACGTGIVARTAADRVGPSGRVVGVDLNPSMLAVAARASRSHPPIEWVEASAESVPYDDESFEIVLCQQGLQFFPDRSAALGEMHRLLAQDGRVLISVWNDVGRGFDALAAALGHHVSPEAGAALAKGPASMREGTELTNLMRAAGFSEVSLEAISVRIHFPSPAEFVRQYVSGTPLAASFDRVTESAREQLLGEVAEQLQDVVDADGLTFMGKTNVGIGIRR